MTRLFVLFALLFLQGAAQTGRFTISGQILWNGSPASGIRVSALEANDAGLDQALLARFTQTDDEGRYRLDEVSPGRYYIVAGSLAQPSFFPGAADRADARLVVVGPGARLESVDFPMADLWCGTPPELPHPQPWTIAANRSGDVFFAELDTSAVQKIAPDGKVTTVADNKSSASLGSVSALAADATGNLYIAEQSPPRIRKVTSAGTITTVAGNGMTGGISGDGGPATSASLCPPTGIAVDGAGNLFIASGQRSTLDVNDSRVRKVDTAGIISTVADGGADPILPTRIAADTLGNLYVGSDTWNLADRVGVRRVTPAGIVETVAGTSPMERTPEKTGPDFSQMQSFSGVAVDGAGNLFVAGVPASSCGNLSQTAWSTSVRKIALTGVITTVAGDPLLREGKCAQAGPPLNLPVLRSPGAFSGNFIAIDGAGNLFISEFDTNTSTASIRKITPDGTLSFFNPAIP